MCGQLYQNIFDQLEKNHFLILIKTQFMLKTALGRLLRASTLPRYAFSQHPKPDQPIPDSQPKPEKQETPLTQQKRQSERGRGEEDDYQDEPLHKQNRNTVGWWIYRFFFWGTFSALSYNIYLVYNHKKKTPVSEQPGAVPYIIDAAQGMVQNYHDFIQFITQPPSKKLLHDPVHPDLHPKTLVLNLNGTIIKTEYVFGKGQKITLRPGLEKMLKRLSQKYEIVIFAEEDEPMIMNAIARVDPRQMHLRGVLGRESMVWKDGEFIKDLRYLNRDLKKVIIVDRTIQNVKEQPKNALILPQFNGSESDKELEKLTLLLDKLADVPDVRKAIESLGENPVDTFYERLQKQKDVITKKAGMFGIGGGKKAQKEQKYKHDVADEI